jgi:glycosyltransferase involved in cell wall biosynthesis
MVDFIIVVSSALKNEIVSYYFLKKERVFIALNSISFDEITINHTNQKEIINKYDIDRKDTVIVCVGELSHRKGQLSLLHAFTQLDELSATKLILLGDGSLYNKLIKMVKEKQLSTCVIIPGYKKDIYDWISLATIYVQPSRYDPLPRAMLEAMYLGKPVIASDIPTMKDVIQHGTTGLLTETTPEKLKNAIEFLISNNELRKEISHKGQQFVLQHCSIKTMSDRIEDFLT